MRSGEVQFVVQRCLEVAPGSGLPGPASLDTSPSPCTVQCGVSRSQLGLVPSSKFRTQGQSSGKAVEAWRSGCPALRQTGREKEKPPRITLTEQQQGEEGKGSGGEGRGVRMRAHMVFGERLAELRGNGSPEIEKGKSSPWKVTEETLAYGASR